LHPPRSRTDGRAGSGEAAGIVRTRCRSFCFLRRGEERWTAFLITYLRRDGQWRGYFSYRAAVGEETLEVRTADLFVEATESEVDQRARGLGRPLVLALLESALHTEAARSGNSPDLRNWFRALLARSSREAGAGAVPADEAEASLTRLRSLYESYRTDQVAHLILLLEAEDFRELVELLLDGRRIDFRANDRLQLAMTVVQELERRLPLPPFEVWAENYLAARETYDRYAEWLHAGGPATG
jgi:hypothetical protein